MDLKSFSEMLDQHGPDPAGWPTGLRSEAHRLIERSPEAEKRLEEARMLKSILADLSPEPAPDFLRSRILVSLPLDRWTRLADWFGSALWRPALAASAALAFGFLIGVLQQSTTQQVTADQYLADELSLLAFSNSFEELPDEY